MSCETFKKLIPGLAMDELDVEERREADRHLADCARCRAERDAIARTHALLKSLPEAETSTTRRDETVAAMGQVRDGMIERAMLRPRRRSGLFAVAAAMLVTVVGWAAWGPLMSGPVYRVASGQGWILSESGSSPLAPGAVLGRGDRIHAREAMRIETAGMVVELAPYAKATLQSAGLFLEDGSLTVEVRKGEATVTDLSNDRLILRPGRFEVAAVRKSGIVASPGGETKAESAVRLKASVLAGSARLQGPNGEVELRAGERGELDVKGYPERKEPRE